MTTANDRMTKWNARQLAWWRAHDRGWNAFSALLAASEADQAAYDRLYERYEAVGRHEQRVSASYERWRKRQGGVAV